MPSFTDAVLVLCAFWAIAGPLLSPRLEEKMEWLVLGLGVAALTVGWGWSETVVLAALGRAAALCGALVAGALAFSLLHRPLRSLVARAAGRLGQRAAVFGAVSLSSLAAPIVTAPVAILMLVEILAALPLEAGRRGEAAVLGSLGVGLGSGLGPLGGPASAVLIAKLSGAAYPVGRGFLLELVGPWAVPGLLALAAGAAVLCGEADPAAKPVPDDPLSLWNLLVLTARLFVFTAGLVLLGAGLLPLIERLFLGLHPAALFWANAAAAVTENAALVTLEVSPSMGQDQLRHLFLGVLAAGSAVLTGDAQNLVAAHKLGISARAWAKVGLPAAAALMVFFFLSLAAL
ncbi:MAG: DUF1646 family protein [Elusimicrobia bacterium]|nr:DUF1646 family protein [Elusimicrobiota bacterium]